MSKDDNKTITVTTVVRVQISKVWELWTMPEHISKWNYATDEWHCPKVVNELIPGGKFVWRMEAKDGSMGFDFSGTYTEVIQNSSIAYTLDDERQVKIDFEEQDNETNVTETFEAENMNSIELQRIGWQAILNNFKKYAESIR